MIHNITFPSCLGGREISINPDQPLIILSNSGLAFSWLYQSKIYFHIFLFLIVLMSCATFTKSLLHNLIFKVYSPPLPFMTPFVHRTLAKWEDSGKVRWSIFFEFNLWNYCFCWKPPPPYRRTDRQSILKSKNWPLPKKRLTYFYHSVVFLILIFVCLHLFYSPNSDWMHPNWLLRRTALIVIEGRVKLKETVGWRRRGGGSLNSH